MKLERNGLSKIGAVSKSCPQTFGMWSVEGLFLDCILLYQAKALNYRKELYIILSGVFACSFETGLF